MYERKPPRLTTSTTEKANSVSRRLMPMELTPTVQRLAERGLRACQLAQERAPAVVLLQVVEGDIEGEDGSVAVGGEPPLPRRRVVLDHERVRHAQRRRARRGGKCKGKGALKHGEGDIRKQGLHHPSQRSGQLIRGWFRASPNDARTTTSAHHCVCLVAIVSTRKRVSCFAFDHIERNMGKLHAS